MTSGGTGHSASLWDRITLLSASTFTGKYDPSSRKNKLQTHIVTTSKFHPKVIYRITCKIVREHQYIQSQMNSVWYSVQMLHGSLTLFSQHGQNPLCPAFADLKFCSALTNFLK